MNPVTAGARPSLEAEPEADATAPLPQPRPAPGEDPETLANRRGGITPRSGSQKDGAAVATTADGRPVRVVGPAYWGAPEQQGVVLTPVPN
jgi:hypothetical protein